MSTALIVEDHHDQAEMVARLLKLRDYESILAETGEQGLRLAREVHRDFEHSLKFARIWGTGVFEGQTVKRDHELHDADVVELHV